jgi:hypothetical protein
MSKLTRDIVFRDDPANPTLLFEVAMRSNDPVTPSSTLSFHVLKETHGSTNPSVDDPDRQVASGER